MTKRAVQRLVDAGVDLGRVATVGPELVRFEGDDRGRVSAVVTADEGSTACDTAVVDLGWAPRDVLARMAPGAVVSAVGSVADDYPLPPPATAGVVCACMGMTVEDLESAFDKGYTEHRAAQAGDAGPASGHARAAPACRTSGRSSPRGQAPCRSRSPPARPLARSRWPRPRPTRDRCLPADAAPR